VAQLSFYSAEANPPRPADLAGLLCGPGQVASFGGTAARVSVVVEEAWRARALVAELAARRVDADVGIAEDGRPLVRTPFRCDLIGLVPAWTRDAVKAVPAELTLDGATLRLWALAAGRWLDAGYRLGLDPAAPDGHEPLRAALARCGLPTRLLDDRDEGPGLRISGRRRLARLAELVGSRPAGVPETQWPAPTGVRSVA
jgi:hypothetical protein